MIEIQNSKHFDLERRTKLFAQKCRSFVKEIPLILAHREDSKQLVRSSGSVAANYIEANESLSKKDFVLRIKICRKESKESGLWLELFDCADDRMARQRDELLRESIELTKIFTAIIIKCA